MSFFRYSARDATGKTVEGTLQATDVRAAQIQLESRGYRVGQIAPADPVRVPVTAPAPSGTMRTARAANKDRFVLFAQIGDLLKAGINPHQAFEMIGARTRHAGLSKACADVALGARDGTPISEVLARYPYLFPPHVVGIVRAGEQGGFLPEACARVSDQAESAHKFARMLWFVSAVILHGVLAIPLMWLFTRGISGMWDRVDASGGAGGATAGLQALSAEMWERFKWPVGPVTGLAYLVFWIGCLVWNAMPMRPLRHHLGLRWVALGPRAKHECLGLFAWSLSRISNAGIAPSAAWEMAVQCVPNLAMRERLVHAGNRLRESRPMSEAFFESRLFPDEYAPMMATAEHTGDVPGTLERLSNASRSEFETSTGKAKVRVGCWASLGCAVTSAIMLIIFASMWYYELPKKILEGM